MMKIDLVIIVHVILCVLKSHLRRDDTNRQKGVYVNSYARTSTDSSIAEATVAMTTDIPIACPEERQQTCDGADDKAKRWNSV